MRPLHPVRETVQTMFVERKVCALRFYAVGGFQGTVASDQSRHRPVYGERSFDGGDGRDPSAPAAVDTFSAERREEGDRREMLPCQRNERYHR